LQVTPSIMRTPTLTKRNTIPQQDEPQQPPSMRSHPIHITPQTNTPTPLVESPTLLPTQGAYGSPIPCLPGSQLNSPSLSPIPPEGTVYRDCEESPEFHTAPTSFVNKTFVNSPARLSEHKVVRQLEPLYGQNLASGVTPSQGSPAPEQAPAGGEAGPSSPKNSAEEWEIQPSSTSNIPHVSRSQRSSPVEQPGWCHDVLIPV
jgi:hypothetical protein